MGRPSGYNDSPIVNVDRLTVSERQRLHEIPSRSLRNFPDALGTTIEKHKAQTPDTWQGWISSPSGAVFIAQENDADVGIAMSAPYRDREGAAGHRSTHPAPRTHLKEHELELVL